MVAHLDFMESFMAERLLFGNLCKDISYRYYSHLLIECALHRQTNTAVYLNGRKTDYP